MFCCCSVLQQAQISVDGKCCPSKDCEELNEIQTNNLGAEVTETKPTNPDDLLNLMPKWSNPGSRSLLTHVERLLHMSNPSLWVTFNHGAARVYK